MRAILVRGGTWGVVLTPEDYEYWIDFMQGWLTTAGDVIEIVDIKDLGLRLTASSVDAVVFFTRGLLEEAASIRKRHNIRTCVLTGSRIDLPKDSSVVIIDKERISPKNAKPLIFG